MSLGHNWVDSSSHTHMRFDAKIGNNRQIFANRNMNINGLLVSRGTLKVESSGITEIN